MSVNFKDNSAQFKSKLEAACMRGMEAVGRQGSANAARLAPVDTGRLKNSITFETSKGGNVFKSTIGTNVEYAKYQEYGTSRMRAQPFLRPAITNNINEYKSIIMNELKGL